MNLQSASRSPCATHPGQAFYSDTVPGFLKTDSDTIIGRLAARHVAFHQAAEAERIRAWTREVEILKAALSWLGEDAGLWSVLIEKPLLRLGQRLDAVLLAPGVVCVIEFKIGASAYDNAARVQSERYAQSLRDFHEVSQKLLIVPVLCAEQAPARAMRISAHDGVADLLLANAQTLATALRLIFDVLKGGDAAIHHAEFDAAAYRPTPTIVEAAQRLYAGHQIADIGRGDASDAELQAAANLLQRIAAESEEKRRQTICSSPVRPALERRFWGSIWR